MHVTELRVYRDDKVHVSPDPDHGTVIDARHLRPLLIAYPPNLPLIGRILIEDESSRGELVVDARWWTDVFNPTSCMYVYIYIYIFGLTSSTDYVDE